MRRLLSSLVLARVAGLGLAGTETRGGYFKLGGEGPFRIALDIRRPGAQRTPRAEFECPSG